MDSDSRQYDNDQARRYAQSGSSADSPMQRSQRARSGRTQSERTTRAKSSSTRRPTPRMDSQVVGDGRPSAYTRTNLRSNTQPVDGERTRRQSRTNTQPTERSTRRERSSTQPVERSVRRERASTQPVSRTGRRSQAATQPTTRSDARERTRPSARTGSYGRTESAARSKSKRIGDQRKLIAIAAAAVALLALLIWGFGCGGFFGTPEPEPEPVDMSGPKRKLAGSEETTDENGIVHGTTPDGINYLVYGRGEAALQKDRVTLVAVGDVVASEYTFPIADNYAGEMDDDEYSYAPYFTAVGPEVRKYDLRLINQETVCATRGEGAWGVAGWPSFNSPVETIEAWVQEGFNIANFNTNHTWDLGDWAIEKTHDIFDEYPWVMIIGSYDSYDDRETVRLIERNGITFAFLSYCYGDNGYGTDPEDMPNEYYACHIDEDAMTADIARARAVADAVIVYMHWGTEYEPEPNDMQEYYARWLADQDVDMVIGGHAHSIQPVRYVTGDSGNTIPVIFGLSDFLCGWSLAGTLFSGMFTCDFSLVDDEVVIDNLVWQPLIEWASDEDGYDSTVRFLEDMTDEEIDANTRIVDVDGSIAAYLRKLLADQEMACTVTWK